MYIASQQQSILPKESGNFVVSRHWVSIELWTTIFHRAVCAKIPKNFLCFCQRVGNGDKCRSVKRRELNENLYSFLHDAQMKKKWEVFDDFIMYLDYSLVKRYMLHRINNNWDHGDWRWYSICHFCGQWFEDTNSYDRHKECIIECLLTDNDLILKKRSLFNWFFFKVIECLENLDDIEIDNYHVSMVILCHVLCIGNLEEFIVSFYQSVIKFNNEYLISAQFGMNLLCCKHQAVLKKEKHRRKEVYYVIFEHDRNESKIAISKETKTSLEKDVKLFKPSSVINMEFDKYIIDVRANIQNSDLSKNINGNQIFGQMQQILKKVKCFFCFLFFFFLCIFDFFVFIF